MKALLEKEFTIGPPGAQIPLICPESRRRLFERDGQAVSLDDHGEPLRSWERRGGFLDLVVGDRFEDHSGEACRAYEIESNTHSTHHYWIPLFQRLFPEWRQRPTRLLAIGCGIAVEVDLLCDAGFACFGIDNGNRTVDWAKRRHSEGLVMANGMSLPFADGSFDAVFCGCVFPHVGVVGDTARTSPQCEAHRQQLAREMVRVARPGGQVIACGPNRWFPFDIFHGRQPGSYRPMLNPPWNRYLLSVSDFRRLFRRAGARQVESLPVDGFWGFVTMRRSWKGRLLSWPIRLAFHAASMPALSFLRPSPLIPWITVHGTV
jgi:SAM-dependent methyltransferase